MEGSIGQALRAARVQKKLSVDDAARLTKILKERIVDLENDELTNFPNIAYARNFTILYAKFLGVDTSQYPIIEVGNPAGVGDYQYLKNARGIDSLRFARQPLRSRNKGGWFGKLVVFAIALITGIGAAVFILNLQRLPEVDDLVKKKNPPGALPTASPSVPPPVVATPTPTPTPTPEPSAAPSVQPGASPEPSIPRAEIVAPTTPVAEAPAPSPAASATPKGTASPTPKPTPTAKPTATPKNTQATAITPPPVAEQTEPEILRALPADAPSNTAATPEPTLEVRRAEVVLPMPPAASPSPASIPRPEAIATPTSASLSSTSGEPLIFSNMQTTPANTDSNLIGAGAGAPTPDSSPTPALPRTRELTIKASKRTQVRIFRDDVSSMPIYDDWITKNMPPLSFRGRQFRIQTSSEQDRSALVVTSDGEPITPENATVVGIEFD